MITVRCRVPPELDLHSASPNESILQERSEGNSLLSHSLSTEPGLDSVDTVQRSIPNAVWERKVKPNSGDAQRSATAILLEVCRGHTDRSASSRHARFEENQAPRCTNIDLVRRPLSGRQVLKDRHASCSFQLSSLNCLCGLSPARTHPSSIQHLAWLSVVGIMWLSAWSLLPCGSTTG